jgi:integrase
MSVIVKLPSGNWRVQIRRKDNYISNTFKRRVDAESWTLEAERTIDRGLAPTSASLHQIQTVADVIDLHIRDLQEVGKPLGRSKAAVLAALRTHLGSYKLRNLNRLALIEYGKKRAKSGAGPATLSVDLSFIGTLLSHAAAVHGVDVSTEEVKLARIALKRLGLVAKGNERDRRPTAQELTEILGFFENNPKQYIPMARIVRFAVATALRLEEICSITDPHTRHAEFQQVILEALLVPSNSAHSPNKEIFLCSANFKASASFFIGARQLIE